MLTYLDDQLIGQTQLSIFEYKLTIASQLFINDLHTKQQHLFSWDYKLNTTSLRIWLEVCLVLHHYSPSYLYGYFNTFSKYQQWALQKKNLKNQSHQKVKLLALLNQQLKKLQKLKKNPFIKKKKNVVHDNELCRTEIFNCDDYRETQRSMI
ncbi:Hypothetical_protein [Hexamita inflata]|uniref:Hypothetical_protein n=1 Tax=Hexamita inflata TaxID=28002 RepID=A0AA86NM43_9EUKA|nr:Hypothetical protein HINF_LOCUS9349 [Hexamita inflata]CAI9975011.1 Hypothetical protein HINF_LOCUS62656 [Hexamita inflata]